MRSPEPAFDLRAAMADELRAAISELDTAEPMALHRCRVRVKRARALARVGQIAAPGLARVFTDTARAAMRTLGQSRDLVAQAELARKLAEKVDGDAQAALAALTASLNEAQAAEPGLNMEAARSGLKDLLALAQVWPDSSARQTRRGAERLAKRARRAWRCGTSAVETAPRHDWRKREQDRFYAALLLGKHWPGKRRRVLSEDLIDTLGRERDTRLLLDRLVVAPELAGENAPEVLKLLQKRRRRLGKRAKRVAARLHRGGV